MRAQSTRPTSRRRRTGGALPLTLFIIVIVTTLSAGAFTMIGTERRVNDDYKASLDAYVIARSGLEEFIGNRVALGFTTVPPAPVESTTVALPGGYASVVMRAVREPVGTANHGLYVIRSRGFRTSDGTQTGTVIGERTVAQYAKFQLASLGVKAAWTAMTGLLKTGGSGVLSGVDACGMEPTLAGVAVPNVPGYSQSGGTSVPAGTPPILSMGTASETVEAVDIDWDAIVNESSIEPDLVFPGATWPTVWTDPSFWPVIRVNGDFTLPADGRGTLIVTGNLTISGSQYWRGVILVGGALTSNGSNTVDGAVVTGLNTKLGMTVPASDLGNGSKTYRYNSCDIASATNKFIGLVAYRNAGTDNWPAY